VETKQTDLTAAIGALVHALGHKPKWIYAENGDSVLIIERPGRMITVTIRPDLAVMVET